MQDDGISVDVSHVDGLYTVTVAGEIDLVSAPALAEELAQIPADASVLLDLGAVTFMDSSGLTGILIGSTRMRAAGGTLRIRRVSLPVRRLLQLDGVDHLIDGGGLDT